VRSVRLYDIRAGNYPTDKGVVFANLGSHLSGLTLRQEFKGERLKGTTIDFSADKPTSAPWGVEDVFLFG